MENHFHLKEFKKIILNFDSLIKSILSMDYKFSVYLIVHYRRSGYLSCIMSVENMLGLKEVVITTMKCTALNQKRISKRTLRQWRRCDPQYWIQNCFVAQSTTLDLGKDYSDAILHYYGCMKVHWWTRMVSYEDIWALMPKILDFPLL